jgi:ribosome-associated translation inhibitor RaiA
MTYNTINLHNLTEKEQELELLREESEISNFNAKYNLGYPIDVKTQYKPIWHTFFVMIKHYFEMEIVPENEINWYYNEFAKVPDENKDHCLTQLYDMFEMKNAENADIVGIFAEDEANREMVSIAEKLSPEMKEAFYYYMNTGEELTPEVRRQLDDELNAVSEAEVYNRLERAFDTKQTLNIGVAPKGKALTPDQVAAKFNLEQSIAPDEEVEAEADEKDPLAQISSQTQSLYKLVQQNRERLSKKEKTESPFDANNDIPTGTHTKPAGLDELLKK